MIDLHSHLLPGVDDGATDNNNSCELFKMAVADGISHMTLTPHVQPGRYENTRKSLAAHFQATTSLIKEKHIDLSLSIAGEVRLCAELLGLYAQDNLPFVGRWGNKNVMLLELPHNGIPPGSDKLVDWFLDRDILPMIAHPERNKAIMEDLKNVAPFINRGCLFQLTAMSITNEFGSKAFGVAQHFLKNDWATIVASDAHNTKHRPPILSKAYQYLVEHYSNDVADTLLIRNPKRIISA
jgi:protein-tyrosine phosphatase